MLGYQINKSTVEALGQENAYFASNFLTLVNVMTFIIFLPILNHLLIPFLSGFTMRIRIGCGLLCNLLCVAIAAIVQVKAFSPWWLSLPAILISLGDALTVVTGQVCSMNGLVFSLHVQPYNTCVPLTLRTL